jgi:hypothetical protein
MRKIRNPIAQPRRHFPGASLLGAFKAITIVLGKRGWAPTQGTMVAFAAHIIKDRSVAAMRRRNILQLQHGAPGIHGRASPCAKCNKIGLSPARAAHRPLSEQDSCAYVSGSASGFR